MEPTDQAAAEKLRAARARAAFLRWYFRHALYALVPRESKMVPTCGVDQFGRLYYNPSFVHSVSVEELAVVLLHEVGHVLRRHYERGRALGVTEATQHIANIAQDCFPAGTMLADGLPIEASRSRTIGGNGGDTACANLRREWDGEVVTLRGAGVEITSTPEHPVWVYQRRHRVGLTPVKLKEPAWIKAGEARVGDFMLVPNVGGDVTDTVLDMSAFGSDHNRSPLKSGFPLNRQTAWLLGLYTAEGSGAKYAQLSLGCTDEERAIADRAVTISRSLGYEGTCDASYTNPMAPDVQNGIRVNLGGPVLARAMKSWCGDGARNKRCPEFILRHSDTQLVRAYLDGLWAGDGAVGGGKRATRHVAVHTSSRGLAAQVRLLLARLGLGFWGTTLIQKDRVLNGRFIPGGAPLYQVGWTWEPRTGTRFLNGKTVKSWTRSWRRCPEGILIPIREIARSHYTGPIYNLSCDKEHSFIAEGIKVHNCELNDDLRDEIAERKDLPPLPGKPWFPADIGCEDNQVWEVYYAHIMDHCEAFAKEISEQLGSSDDGGDGPEQSGDRADDGKPGSGQGSGQKKNKSGKGQSGKGQRSHGGWNGRHKCGSAAHGVKQPWEDPSPSQGGGEGIDNADWRDIEKRVARDIRDEAKKSRGTVPGHWVEWADDVLRPVRIPWEQEIAGEVRWAINDVAGLVIHTYRRPSRRQSAVPDVLLPSMRRPVPVVAIVGDTSGSMSEEDLALVRGTVSDIAQAMGATVAFIATDAAVHGGVQRVHDGRHAVLAGRGGTDMRVGIECAITEVVPRPDVVVVITDCYTPWPEEEPPVRVIVAAVRPAHADVSGFGEAISGVPEWAKVVVVHKDEAGL